QLPGTRQHGVGLRCGGCRGACPLRRDCRCSSATAWQLQLVIDEFAITTRYSPDTGRPEPMLTIGKRISERVRLSASTGLAAEDRTFQSQLEWRVSDQTSFQMVYDNINRESASNVGNVGLDLHWRIEFE
ncbi:MAG: translocation/assembly module TamB domain-containing protein, partial [Myxococcota bacterium]